MLWRLHLDGVDTGARFAALADAWSTAADGRRWYAFNDVHATLAYAGAGRLDDAQRLVERMARYANGEDGTAAGWNVAMTAEIGLPASLAHPHEMERIGDVGDVAEGVLERLAVGPERSSAPKRIPWRLNWLMARV